MNGSEDTQKGETNSKNQSQSPADAPEYCPTCGQRLSDEIYEPACGILITIAI